MPDHFSTMLDRALTYIERCLATLEEAALPPSELAFLQTFLTHARGYLVKDVSADTEALGNWDSPENRAMIARFLTHVEQRIRLTIEDWQHDHAHTTNTAFHAKMIALLADLDQLRVCDDAEEDLTPGQKGNGHT